MKHHIGRLLISAAVLFATAPLWSDSAFAITNSQFTRMCQAKVGLRSAMAPDGGAAYAFDDAVAPRVCVVGPVPVTWNATLAGTIHYIFGQPGYQHNNLYLLNPCAGTGERYLGTFPKCMRVGQPLHVYAQTPIGQQTEAEVINWINQEIDINFP